MAAITLDIGGNTRQLDRDIQKTVNKVYSINLKTKGDQPLGRITGQVNEFNKSLDASNARVIAFGASAGIIFGVERAFGALVQATIEVQKSLQDINVILNASQANLQKFGAELFSIARNTGQSFQEVAKAATEFSRQGLGIEETLKRTSEALILSRLSGLDAAKSVESLTAAVNSFASQAVTATEVVNKFATVDAAFAVSSADLADAIARVGSSAAQSGVSLNELIAIVTSAQQTTARGGAVIGNSFKTIFTRLQREKVVDLLESLGISGTDSSGQVKSTIQLLQELGAVYDTLGSQQQAYVAEQVGGVFQINILKAALADLGKEYSIYSSALNVAAGATDQAIRRNEELNKTYAAQINALAENARQLAAAGGERLLGPSIDRLVGGTNTLLEGFSESDGQGVGAVLGKGILDGIGQFIAGPGLALIGGVLLKLFRDLAKFATGSVQQLLGLNTAATQQRDLQQSINQILAKNPQLLELALKGEQGLNTAANSLLASLQKQTVELQKQAAVAQQISKAFVAQAGVRVAGGVPVVPTPKTGRTGKAAGYIPNFAEEFQAKEFGATPSVKAVRGVGKIGGKSFEANNQEFQFQNFAGTGETAVIPKYGNGIKEAAKMIARGESGSVLDKSDRKKAKGFVPNFAAVDTVANLQKQASRSAGLLNQLYNVGDPKDKGIRDEYLRPAIKRAALQKNISQYTKEADSYIKNARAQASSNPSSINKVFQNLKYSGIPISKFTDKVKPETLLDPKKDRFNNTNIKGAMGEIDSQKRFGSGRRTAEKQGDLFGADFLVRKQGGNYLVESKITQRKISDNILIAKALQYEGKTAGGKYKNRTIDEVKLKNIILSYAPFKNAASGFIPNFAKQKQASKNAIDLGNLDTIPNKLGNKVVSLIYPGLSDSYSLNPATASYLKQEYTGRIPVAGINQKKLKSQIPDLDKNLGDLLVKEANQFGQSLGGSNFLQSAKDLPNFGAAQGAVGVAFEGGVQTLLTQKVARKQNAGIDFRNVTPRLRSIFNDAPGMYDAKSSSALTNEVFKKLLNETKPGATVKKTSGKAGEDYVAKRTAAVEQLRKEGVTGSVAIRQALRDRFGIVGKAAGYIPNFAAIQAPLQNAVNNEIAAGASSNQIRIDKNSKLKTSLNPDGLGVWSKKYEGSLPEGIRMAEKAGINPKTKGMPKAGGYIPNFAIEDPDTQAASAGTAISAVVAQLGFLAFSLQGSREQYKQSLKELTKTNVAQAKINSKNLREQVASTVPQPDFSQYSGEKGKVFGDLRRSRSPEEQASRDAAARQLKESRSAQKTAAKGTGGQKFAAASGAGGFALSIGAPVIAETIKNAIGQETAGARKTGAAVGAAGQIASFAGAGAMFGPWGAAIGAATGALLTVPGLIDEMTATVPEFAKAAAKASQDLTKFNDAGQRVLTSSAELSKLLKEGGSKNSIQKAQEAYNKSLLDLSSTDRQRLATAAKLGKLEEEYAKVLAEKVAKERSAQSETSLAGVRDEIVSDKTKTGLTFGAGAFALGNAILPGLGSTAAPFVGSIAATQKDYLNLGTEEGRKRRAGIAETFTTELRGNKGPEEFLNSLRDIKIPKEVTNKAQFDSFVNGLKELPSGFKNTLKEIAAEDPQAAFQLLRAQIIYLRKDTADFIKDSAALQAAEDERQAVLKQEQAAIDATVSSIQKNIAIQNLWRSAIENINESIRSFSDDLQITQTLTQPKEVLSGLIGEDKTPTRRLAAQEGIARIDQTTRSGLAASGIEFKETLRGITQTPFQENIDKIVKKLGEQGGALEGEPEDIIKQSGQFQSEAKAEAQKLLQTTEKMEAYMAQFVSGQISTQQLLEQSRTELAGVGIDVSRGSQASDAIEKAVAELEVKSIQEQVKAFQQRAKLASETKQAILQDKINQAIGTFGGFEGFMNRPEEKENYIQRITPDLEKIEEMRGSATFRYNNKESRDEQKKQSPELGRAFANVYKELIGQSGGAFRNVIQKSIDKARQQTGVESRSGKAGASALGGFDDIVQGRATDLEQQLKLAKDQLKVTTDPVLKRDLEGFISEIENLGIDRIAKLQTMQEFGVARQSDFQEIYGEFENQSLERLKEISPELAASLSDAVTFGDPLLAEAQVQSGVQTQILQTIQKAISGQAAGTTGAIEPIDLEAYANEKDPAKRAAMKAGYGGVTPIDMGSTAGEAVKNQIKAIQDKVLPTTPKPAVTEPQKTIAEIEAETKKQRDQKYLKSPIAPLNRTTGKKFESIDQVDAEMTKALALGAINPEQKEYYNVLKNFKQNLNPTGGQYGSTDGRRAMFMLDDKNRPVDPNSPSEIEKRTVATRDQKRFEEWSRAGGIGLGPNRNAETMMAQGNMPGNFDNYRLASQVDMVDPTLSTTKAFNDKRVGLDTYPRIQDEKQEIFEMLNPDVFEKTPSRATKDYIKNNPFSKITYDNAMVRAGEPVARSNQNINQQPAAAQQSFTQQEAAFSNNTSALTTLAGGIESLNSTLSNFESNFTNLNNVPGGQQAPNAQQGGAQPNVQTTTSAPVNVVVNAQGSNDIAQAVGQAVQNAIPTIIEKVRISMGEKVPPTSNPKFGAGQRADGGFLL